MHKEIEFKVKISKEEFINFLQNKEIWKSIYINGLMVKEDILYESTNGVVRLRKNSSSSLDEPLEEFLFKDNVIKSSINSDICYKEKKIINGYENNEESESEVANPETFVKIMKAVGSKEKFRKEKRSISIGFDNLSKFKRLDWGSYGINPEFICVNQKYLYLEIEAIVDVSPKYFIDEINESKISEVISILEEAVKTLGFDPSKKDSRPWMEIVKE